MLKKIWLICLMILFMGQIGFADNGSFTSVEKKFSKTFKFIDRHDYALYYENAMYSITSNKMFLPRKWRGYRSAYIYGCDRNGQLKSYVDMKYSKKAGELQVDVRVTYDGPSPALEASALVYKVGNGILEDMEKYAKEPTVRVLQKVSLRAEPTSKSKRIRFLNRGELFKFLSREKKWVQVSSVTDPKLTGWVYHSYVRKR